MFDGGWLYYVAKANFMFFYIFNDLSGSHFGRVIFIIFYAVIIVVWRGATRAMRTMRGCHRVHLKQKFTKLSGKLFCANNFMMKKRNQQDIFRLD